MSVLMVDRIYNVGVEGELFSIRQCGHPKRGVVQYLILPDKTNKYIYNYIIVHDNYLNDNIIILHDTCI